MDFENKEPLQDDEMEEIPFVIEPSEIEPISDDELPF